MSVIPEEPPEYFGTDDLSRALQEQAERGVMADALLGRVEQDLLDAEAKAWDALARYKFQMFGYKFQMFGYKFQMFGYWAAIWVHLNRIGEFKRPNPWAELVKLARGKQ